MKKILFILFTTIFVSSLSDAQIPGTKIPGPLIILDSIQVREGDVLKLGHGSDPRTGDFVFIYAPANGWAGTPLIFYANSYSNTTLKVKFFKEYEQRKIGKKIFVVVDAPGINRVVELEAAIKSGEIVAINDRDITIKEKSNTLFINQQISVSDELLKLKKLLNDSIISQEEYNIQKKKLLETK